MKLGGRVDGTEGWLMESLLTRVFSHHTKSNNLERTLEDGANMVILNMLIRWFYSNLDDTQKFGENTGPQ